MISDQDKKLVQEIFLQMRNPAVHEEVMKEPEVYHRSLLNTIKEKLGQKYSGVLRMDILAACYEDNLKKAREELGQPVSIE